MSYAPFNSLRLTLTGLVLTAGTGDFGSVALPSSGRFLVYPNVYFYNIASTGIPVGMGFDLFTGASGVGQISTWSQPMGLSLGTPSGLMIYSGNSARSFIGSGITVRQTAVSSISGLIGIAIDVVPLPF